MIVVAGEALVDLVATGGSLQPFPGGGPFNTAVALARLRVPVAFLGRLSRDRYGRLLDGILAEQGVDRRYVLHGDAPTPLAVVHPDGAGDADYSFYLAGTAYAELTAADIPPFADDVVALHVGTLALATDPPAATLVHLVEREAGRRLVVVDPNVRPAVIADDRSYRQRLEACFAHADVVKLSAADASWLYPGTPPESVAESFLDAGAALAVVTLGEDGALARTQNGFARVTSPPTAVVDTVGAGDTFGAALLRRLADRGALTAAAVGALDDGALREALVFAVTAGALQCTSAGAHPPALEDVLAAWTTTP